MAPGGAQGAGRPRRQFRLVEVARLERPGPRLVRVTFGGDSLATYEPGLPAAHVKVLFPRPGEAPVVPTWGPEGMVLPPGAERPVSRTYTPRRFDADHRQLEIDFVLHGDGPGSTWAAHVEVGDQVVIAGPGGGYAVDLDASSFVLAGDETALPAISTILTALPPTATAHVVAEVGSPKDRVDLGRADQIWLYREGSTDLAGDLLTEQIRALEVPADGTQVWVGCEASAVRTVRRYLLGERGLDRAAVHTRGYWRYGEANHPDHDTGED